MRIEEVKRADARQLAAQTADAAQLIASIIAPQQGIAGAVTYLTIQGLPKRTTQVAVRTFQRYQRERDAQAEAAAFYTGWDAASDGIGWAELLEKANAVGMDPHWQKVCSAGYILQLAYRSRRK